MGFKTFEDIEAWQNARKLMNMVNVFARKARDKYDWGWANQIVDAAVSVMANIAEGHDAQTNPEFVQFLGYSKRSCAEVRSHLYYGLDVGYVSQEEFDETSDLTKFTGAQLAKLIKHLKQHPEPPEKNTS